MYMTIRRNFFMDDDEQWSSDDLMWLGIIAATISFWLVTMVYTW